jgi:dTDP-4-amino-4,6-dideoxygalactose transaminase
MTLGMLRPVGEYVRLFPEHREFRWPEGYELSWLDSGTSALAIAVKAACTLAHRPHPRVLIPAYTCPDVVSAIVWAGAQPVLVDTKEGTPWLDVNELSACLDDSVAAVVAPHFLGIPHPMEALSEMCRDVGVVLIEDSAQLGPTSPAFRPSADLVVLSFGRGKPVPAGGGALLYRKEAGEAAAGLLSTMPQSPGNSLAWRTRIALQNIGMSRLGFGLARRMPGLHVGETRYRALSMPNRMPETRARLAASTLSGWPRSTSIASAARELEDGLAGQSDLEPVARILGWDGEFPLLRLPVLARDRADRDALVAGLLSRGIGASMLYGAVLPSIDNMPVMETRSKLENAGRFADRLVTLPCHSGVTSRDVDTIREVARPLNRMRHGAFIS